MDEKARDELCALIDTLREKGVSQFSGFGLKMALDPYWKGAVSGPQFPTDEVEPEMSDEDLMYMSAE